ncbi:ATPase, AAA family protein [Coccidioides posadasii C735 delta SOWgp]|uniref:ATPase, AAA family protein n=1 Tax=Coccidioides posadasii (strain C735) TaxID=222929 RepID=C5P3N2_COCP7|nr:ATPase, AAA family protein [Coccidioides posadasii C735 delta SOWgp]EER28300.1 ATPase, AAA family protein [Coccidioides posadasii C735 delta SOWgp]|eukprot:XP_003070445.1 ATPase, AAA family protein [Coccidioides posadasii C735 delta SOWgp]
MAEGPKFTVRPVARQPRNDSKDAFRIFMSPASLLQVHCIVGEPCQLRLDGGPPKTAIAWSAPERIHDNVVQTSKLLQTLYGFKLGDKVTVTRAEDSLRDIGVVRLEECSDPAATSTCVKLDEKDQPYWEWALEHPLSKCEILAVDMVFECELKKCRRTFKVVEIDPGRERSANTIARFTSESKVKIGSVNSVPTPKSGLEVDSSGLGGLGPQIKQINERLRDFTAEAQKIDMPSFFKNSGGILIYGSKGTGKTSLLAKIEAAGWRNVFTVKSSIIGRSTVDGEAKLRKIFAEALKSQPSLIAIDQLDFLAPRRGSNDAMSMASVLCENLDSLQNNHVLVVACTRHPNDVDDTLRTPHRLGIEIELPVPTGNDRAEILRALRGSADQPCDDLLAKIAAQTHGYVGADLFSLLQLSCRKAQTRQLSQSVKEEAGLDQNQAPAENPEPEEPSRIPLEIREEDVALALQETRPTAMREVFLETPAVRWKDIGGQREIKRYLQKAVERPLRHPERMKRFNVSGKKGVLLYGPPGCSKTLTVKALATEAGLNFLAVKGAEILSMYVGESERALREIFRKARAARPSIIFFDEIDAIAGRRGPGSQSGINVLTTLLNEMDGIEELKNVLVVAATNKPETLDPALMRPGRLDNILYVGLPDMEARKEILDIWFSKSEVHDEVDPIALASRTEGYSGAELVNVCETAADAALDEEEELGEEGKIKWEHFEKALGQVPKQISPAVIREYDRWSKEFGNR